METSVNARYSPKTLLFFALTLLVPCLAFGQLKVNVRVGGGRVIYRIQKHTPQDSVLVDRFWSESTLYQLEGGKFKPKLSMHPFEEVAAQLVSRWVPIYPGEGSYEADLLVRYHVPPGDILFVHHRYRYRHRSDPKSPFVWGTYEAIECIRAE